MADRPRRALVFSGGGARGAYEAGVVRYLFDELPRRLGHPIEFDVLAGSSVGAIHACYLGATADQDGGRGARLANMWTRLRIEQVLPISRRDVMGLGRRLFGLRRTAEAIRGGEAPDRLYGLLDTRALERQVIRMVPWRSIHNNVRTGRIEAVCVAATEIATGRVVVFTDTRDHSLTNWSPDPNLVAHLTRIHPSHALASAAIPLLFPVVKVANTYFGDGGLRLNTPLAPALRLGADKILVVALRPHTQHWHAATLADHRVEDYASPAYLLGKILNALMLDHLDTDLARMRVINGLLERGGRAFGSHFLDRMNAVSEAERGQRFRIVDDLVIRPSSDLGLVAGDVLRNLPKAAERSPLFRIATRNLEPGQRSPEAELLSYLLFDGEFAGPLADLGYRDAQAHEEDLARFFGD